MKNGTRAGAATRPPRTNASRHRERGWDLLLLAVSGLILCYIWRLQSVWSILATFQVPMLSLAAACGLFLLDRDPRRTVRVLRHPIGILVLALLAVMAISVPFSFYQGYSFYFVVQTHPMTVLAFALVAASVRSFDDLEKLMKVWIVGALLYSLQALINHQTGVRPWLVTYDNNDYAFLLATTLPMCIYFGKEARKPWWRLLCVASLVLFGGMLVLTSSRTGFVAGVVCISYLLLKFRVLPARYRAGTVLVLVAVGLFAANEEYKQDIYSIFRPTQDYNWVGESPRGRLEIWKRGIGYWWDSPIIGLGPKNFSRAEGHLSEIGRERQSRKEGWKWSAPHNSYLQILTELGLVGFAVFLGLLWSAFKGLRALTRGPPAARGDLQRRKSMAHALTASLLAYAAGAMFLTHGYSEFLYILLGLCLALLKTSAWTGWLPAGGGSDALAGRGSPSGRGARLRKRPHVGASRRTSRS